MKGRSDLQLAARGDAPSPSPSDNDSFVFRQLGSDKDEKQSVAEWVCLHVPLKDNGGAVVDAGSSCLALFDLHMQQMLRGDLRFPAFVTNNFLVPQRWWEYRKENPAVSTAMINLYGKRLDPEHMALFEGDVATALMDSSFRPTNVYIGLSGIDFEPQGIVRCGYHGGKDEREIKELLFCKPCKQRIILLTPRKIGEAGGFVFDLRGIENLDKSAPIYLVTARPERGSSTENQFRETFERFREARGRLLEEGLRFHWVTIERNGANVVTAVNDLSVYDSEPDYLPATSDARSS